MTRGDDEYIDYSCSTPLERLARDVETLLRSWHIVEGSDRHVSFHHREQRRGTIIGSRSSPLLNCNDIGSGSGSDSHGRERFSNRSSSGSIDNDNNNSSNATSKSIVRSSSNSNTSDVQLKSKQQGPGLQQQKQHASTTISTTTTNTAATSASASASAYISPKNNSTNANNKYARPPSGNFRRRKLSLDRFKPFISSPASIVPSLSKKKVVSSSPPSPSPSPPSKTNSKTISNTALVNSYKSPPQSPTKNLKSAVNSFNSPDKNDSSKKNVNANSNEKHEKFHTPGRMTPRRKNEEETSKNKNNNNSNTTAKAKAKATSDVQIIRSGKVILTTIPLNCDSHHDRIQIELELCLWDGPPTTSTMENAPASTLASAPASSSHSPSQSSLSSTTSGTVRSSFSSCSEENKLQDSDTGNVGLGGRTESGAGASIGLTTGKTNQGNNKKNELPLSLTSNRNSPLNVNLLSNLSHLLGIGQHLTLSPTSQSTINSCLSSAVEALLSAQQPSRWKHHHSQKKSSRSSSNSASTSTNHNHINNNRNSESSSHNNNHNNSSSTSSSPLPLPLPLQSMLSPSRVRSAEDEIALRTTALQALSNQLQMALNIATAACDCRIPAFGIWGLYRSSIEKGRVQIQRQQQQQQQQNDLDVNFKLNSNLNSQQQNQSQQQQQQHQQSEVVALSQSIMDIPIWMNTGNIFNIAAESSSIGSFLRCIEKMRREEEENDSLTVDNSIDEEYDSEDDRSSNQYHYTHTSPPPSPSRSPVRRPTQMNLTPPRKSSYTRSSKGTNGSRKNRSNQFGEQLLLPAFINGNCHPGPSFFGVGASFIVHVVPPGVSYPIHCTTLNSLGQLLLQHCPPVSLSGILKMRKMNVEEQIQLQQGKVSVIGARHKYTWTNIFQYDEDYIPGQDEMLLAPLGSDRYHNCWDSLNILTYGLSWRNSCQMDAFKFVSSDDNRIIKEGINDKHLNIIISYRQECRKHAMKMLYRISCIAKTKRSKKSIVSKKSLEPIWGPTADPITMVSVAATWGASQINRNWEDGGGISPPLLNLPLRIRSHHTMSSQDVLEMENTLLSTIFNPVSVPSSDFVVNISFDPDAACTTLSAANRCLLAALIRACTLESDTLIAHITKSNILEELHDRAELDFVAEEIMEKAAVSSITRRLVQVMDWGSMADMIDDDAWGNEARFQDIIDEVFESDDFPSPPESVFDSSQAFSDTFSTESAAYSFVDNASPHGRFLSILFASMASLQTPSAMSALWMAFVSALRLRWEQRERLHNFSHVPGIDDMIPCGSIRTQKKNHFSNALGSRAKNAAFVNSTEPEPALNDCLINQKLQVFNIGVEAMIAMEMKEMQLSDIEEEKKQAPQSIEEFEQESPKKGVKFTNVEHVNSNHDGGGEIMNVDSESCEFRSCGTGDDYQDAFENDIPPQPLSDHAILKEHIILQGNFSTGEVIANKRKGARCPVQGYSLSASGDQLYAPYLQREMPLTNDLVIARRQMLAETETSTIRTRMEIAQRLQKSKLLNDMSAFKAANPGAVFQDFTNWYGNPENPLEMYDTTDIFNSSNPFMPSKNKSPEEEMAEAIFVLNATRTFWPETWDEAEPIPATEQKPLFDAYSTVEMLLQSLESMHPSILLNQILAVNLSIANFVLKSSMPSCRINIIDDAIDRMERTINNAVSLLSNDVANNSKISKEDIGKNNPFKFISTETINICEKACTYIGDAEILLSRATSLLSKFSGDVDVVEKILRKNTENCTFEAQSATSRSGILNSIYSQQQRNSGKIMGGMNDMPAPSVREYIIHNRDENSPCQLTVCIGGTHGLEQGGTNSTKGGLVLALNKCVKGIQ